MAKEETEDGLKINWDLFTQLIVNRFRLAIGFGMGNLHEAFGYHKVMKEKDIWEICFKTSAEKSGSGLKS